MRHEHININVVMAEHPLVSIITPVKNRPELVQETLRSVQAQTYPHWEALVVDDRSTDKTLDVLRDMATQDERIRPLRRPEGKGGAPVCRNVGVQEAEGAYIIYLDSDDMLAPHCLEERVQFMEAHPELDFGVFQGGIFYEEPGDTDRMVNLANEENDLDRFLRRDITWQTTGPIYRKSAVDKVGEWDEDLPGGQDVDYATRAMALGLEHECVNEIDYYVRSSRTQRGRISENKWRKPERLRSCVYRVEKLLQLLRKQGKFNVKRKRLIAGNFFFVAEHWVDIGEEERALQVWKRTRQLGLIDLWKYLLGRLYIRVRETRLAPFLAYHMYHCWPSSFFIKTRLQGGRYTVGQEPGIYEVPITDGQHPFRSFARVFQKGPVYFLADYVVRKLKAALAPRTAATEAEGHE